MDDKLTHAQRVRLEAFGQAINVLYVLKSPSSAPPPPPPTMAEVFARAEEIEAWLLKAEDDQRRVYRERPILDRRTSFGWDGRGPG